MVAPPLQTPAREPSVSSRCPSLHPFRPNPCHSEQSKEPAVPLPNHYSLVFPIRSFSETRSIMVKHLSCLMTRFFTRERFGRPQFLAGVLLLAFLAQASWLVHSELTASKAPGASEQTRIAAGWRQLHGGNIAGAPYPDLPSALPMEVSLDNDFDTEHSPLLPLATASPLLASPQSLLDPQSSSTWRWLPRVPFLACGLLLGASLWYVARRLCGNTGGFLALTLYCFSPSMIQASAVWHTEP